MWLITMITPREQHLHNAKLQRQWAAMAKRDATYNQKRAEAEIDAKNTILAAQYRKEASDDTNWFNRRIRIANYEERLARGMK